MSRFRRTRVKLIDTWKRVKKSISRSNSPEPSMWSEADIPDDRSVVPQATYDTPMDSEFTSFIVLPPFNSTNPVAEDSVPTIAVDAVDGNPESLGPSEIPFKPIANRNHQHNITVLQVQKSVSRPNSPEPSPEDRLVVPQATHHASMDSDSTSPIVLTRSNSTNPVPQDSIPTTTVKVVEGNFGPTKSPFKPIANRDPQHDIAVLHVAFVLGSSQALQVLILRVVDLNNMPMFKNLADSCLQFTIKLIGALDAKVDGVEEAIAAFLKTMEDTISNKLSETQMTPHRITDSIVLIEATYPNIARTAEKKHSNRFSTIASGVVGFALPMLDIIKEGSSMIPVPMVQPLIGIVAGFLKAADQASNNFECMRWLSATVAKYVVRIAMACPPEIEERWTQAVNTLQQELSGIVQDAENFCGRRLVDRFLHHNRDKDDIARIKESLRAAIDSFNVQVELNIKLDLDTISRKIDNILLDKLERLPSYSDSNGQYFSDSRQQEIQKTLDWIENASAEHFLWIHGAAGVGKSMFARELLDHLKREGILATYASFVIGIDSKPKELVRMMARELSSLHPGCRPDIARALTECSGEHEHLEKYLTHFLIMPITSLAYAGPLVIILDALDEYAYRQEFLKDLFQVVLPSKLKIVMTSRYSQDIQSIAGEAAQLCELTPVSNAICRDYFVSKFQHIDWEGHTPEPSMFDKLVKLADGLLIWAATVCMLVSTPSPDTPIEIIDGILSSSSPLIGEERMEILYLTALKRLFPDKKSEFKDIRLKILLSMVALKEPLPLKEFAHLVGVRSTNFLKDTCSGLRALQTRGTFDDNLVQPAIKLFHASFLDYLGHDKARHIMVDNCLDFFKQVTNRSNPDVTEEQGLFPFLETELYVYMGNYWASHLEEGKPEKPLRTFLDVTSDQLRMWVAWSLSRLLFLDGKHDYQPSSLALQTFSIALCSAQGISYSPELFLLDLSTTQAIVTNLHQVLDLGGIDYRNPDFYSQNPICAHHWALVLNGFAIGLQQIQRPWLRWNLVLDAAIEILNNLISTYPPDRPNLQVPPSFLDNLGLALRTRSELENSRDDLDRAISFHMKARDLREEGSRDYAISLGNLGRALHSRFQYFGSNPGDLEQAIAYHRQAIRWIQPSDYSLRASSLYALGDSLIQARSLEDEKSDCLEEAMSSFCAVAQFLPQSAYDLRIYVARKEGLMVVFQAVALYMQRPGSYSRKVQFPALAATPGRMKTFGHDRYRITIVEDYSAADLAVEREDDGISFVILDKRVAAYGLTMCAHKAKANAEDLIPVLIGAAHYHRHLNWSYLSSQDIKKQIIVEFFKLEETREEEDIVFRPIIENMIKDGVIIVPVSDGDFDPFGIRITNNSKKDLYPNVFYFDNNDLSIQQIFGFQESRGYKVNPPLVKDGGKLSLGFGAGGVRPMAFSIPDGQDVEVGWLKCFFSTSPLNSSEIAGSSPFMGAHGPALYEWASNVWGSIPIPIVQKRIRR